MKRPAAILFVFLLLIQSGGYLLFFFAEQGCIRHEVKEELMKALPEESLVILTSSELLQDMTVSSALFLKDNEIRYLGRMYDIVRTEQRGGETIYYCFADHKESELLAGFEDLINSGLSDHPATQQTLQWLSHLNLIFLPTDPQYALLTETLTHKNICIYFFSSITWISKPLTPPPARLS